MTKLCEKFHQTSSAIGVNNQFIGEARTSSIPRLELTRPRRKSKPDWHTLHGPITLIKKFIEKFINMNEIYIREARGSNAEAHFGLLGPHQWS